jgi:ActR/RegA family two-component response regulator
VAEQKPKLALVDINLKKEMAYDLIEELHRQDILVIVVSGYAVPKMPAEMVAAFVQKAIQRGRFDHGTPHNSQPTPLTTQNNRVLVLSHSAGVSR